MTEPRGVEDETRLAERAMEPDDPAPEERALHIVSESALARIADPELALMAEEQPTAPEYHFADEEYEGRPPRDWGEEDHEPDLEEVLEKQHYAFAEEHGKSEED